jgi:hypothetical protein
MGSSISVLHTSMAWYLMKYGWLSFRPWTHSSVGHLLLSHWKAFVIFNMTILSVICTFCILSPRVLTISATILWLERKAPASMVYGQLSNYSVFYFLWWTKLHWIWTPQDSPISCDIHFTIFPSIPSRHFKLEYRGGHVPEDSSLNIHCSDTPRFHTAVAMTGTSSDVILSCKNPALCIVCPLPCCLQSNNLHLMRLCL